MFNLQRKEELKAILKENKQDDTIVVFNNGNWAHNPTIDELLNYKRQENYVEEFYVNEMSYWCNRFITTQPIIDNMEQICVSRIKERTK